MSGDDFYELAAKRKLAQIGHVLLVGSGKGGVGKSFVACGLALTLSRMGLRTGILDVDIHGASVAGYLGLEAPVSSSSEGLEPKVVAGVKAMSIALFTGSNPVPVRGREKEALMTKLFALTSWGPLDCLVVDLPPTTGDEFLVATRLFAGKSSIVLVTTPSRTSLDIVRRLRPMVRTEGLRLDGIVLNMAFMGEGRRKEFPFGRPSPSIGRLLGSKVLVHFPLDPDVSSRPLREVLADRNQVSAAFGRLARAVAPGASSRSRRTRAHSQH